MTDRTKRSTGDGEAARRAGMPPQRGKADGGTVEDTDVVLQAPAARGETSGHETHDLMSEVVRDENLDVAAKRVVANKGAPGVDGMTVDELATYLRVHWARIREELLNRSYIPAPVKRVDIPKPDGKGTRMLGIPTVLDRFIQQALLQVLTPIFDPTFSEDSHGFRPGRSTHGAVLRAKEHIAAGNRVCVDLDLEKFFDRVNHDILMARVARRIKDKRVLHLIRRYLQAGCLVGGLVSPREEGTPQGGPISPLLSNVLLDDLDKELERRGHRFVRYADDCNVYVRSQAAGERVMASLERFLAERLKLKVNREKSAVDRPWKRKFLGYTVDTRRTPRLKASKQSIEKLRTKIRVTMRLGRGHSLAWVVEELKPKIVGWTNYFKLAETIEPFKRLDKWLRRRLRCIVWRHWKRPSTRLKELLGRGVSRDAAVAAAYGRKGPWPSSKTRAMHIAIPNKKLQRLGLVSFLETHEANRSRT